MKEARIVYTQHCQKKNTRKGVLDGRDKTLCLCKCDNTSQTFLNIGLYISWCLSCLRIPIIHWTCLKLPAQLASILWQPSKNPPCSPGCRFFPALSLYLGGKTNSSSNQRASMGTVISSAEPSNTKKKHNTWSIETWKHTHFHHMLRW